MWRSVAAVGGGFLATMVAVMAGTVAATVALVPGGLAAISQGPAAGSTVPRAYLVANLLVGFAGAMLGGWIAARVAPGSPSAHGAALAGLVLILGLISAMGGAAPGQPSWYPWLNPLIGCGGVLAGAALAASR